MTAFEIGDSFTHRLVKRDGSWIRDETWTVTQFGEYHGMDCVWIDRGFGPHPYSASLLDRIEPDGVQETVLIEDHVTTNETA